MTMKEQIELFIQADTNDADYVNQTTVITEEDLQRFKPLIEAIAKNSKKHTHNWEVGEYARGPSPTEMYPQINEDLIQEFSENCVPFGAEGVGTHTIVKIQVRKINIVEQTDYVNN